mgnify:CR=1 FL=1
MDGDGWPKPEACLKLLEKRLSLPRMAHCISVGGYLAALAPRLGLEEAPALCAGLLHDVCRDLRKSDMLARAERHGLVLEAPQRTQPILLHGPLAAGYCRRKLNIGDEAVLEAIHWHTTGRPGLGRLGQALYFCDFSEPLRTYPEAAEARRMLDAHGFDAALRYVAENKLRHLEKRAASDPVTESFLAWLFEGAAHG